MRFLLVWYFLASLATFAAFALDKSRARRAESRIPERTLHLLEALGGWPGALAAMIFIRHKNRKPRFWIVTALIAAAHVAVLVWWRMR